MEQHQHQPEYHITEPKPILPKEQLSPETNKLLGNFVDDKIAYVDLRDELKARIPNLSTDEDVLEKQIESVTKHEEQIAWVAAKGNYIAGLISLLSNSELINKNIIPLRNAKEAFASASEKRGEIRGALEQRVMEWYIPQLKAEEQTKEEAERTLSDENLLFITELISPSQKNMNLTDNEAQTAKSTLKRLLEKKGEILPDEYMKNNLQKKFDEQMQKFESSAAGLSPATIARIKSLTASTNEKTYDNFIQFIKDSEDEEYNKISPILNEHPYFKAYIALTKLFPKDSINRDILDHAIPRGSIQREVFNAILKLNQTKENSDDGIVEGLFREVEPTPVSVPQGSGNLSSEVSIYNDEPPKSHINFF